MDRRRGEGRQGREKNREVRGEEEAKRRNKGDTHSLPAWKGLLAYMPWPWNLLAPNL